MSLLAIMLGQYTKNENLQVACATYTENKTKAKTTKISPPKSVSK